MPADPRRSWTTLATLRGLSKGLWDRGQLLRELVEPTEAYPRRRALKRPTAAELRSDYPAARAWAAELFAAAGKFSLETTEAGRTTIGSNTLPSAAVFGTAEDEIAFAGRTQDAARFRKLAAELLELDAALGSWVAKRPLQLLELDGAALTAARAARWLRDNPAPGIYIRQLSLPGVHTKFIETHRRIIDEMTAALRSLDAAEDDAGTTLREDVAGDNAIDDDPNGAALSGGPAGHALLSDPAARTPAARFAARHGFAHPPEQVRFRILDPGLPALGSARDITVTAEAFASLHLPVRTIIATENLVNFLALPERPDTVALFGRGYGFSALREAHWLRHCEILYWGDLDTHGFRILDQLRAVHPHVVSLLMDQETLLAHRDAWGHEPSPSRAALTRLTEAESAVYKELGSDAYGRAVRLEQELIRWDWALERLLR
ncbi:Wadjet anti-phage system protein JetD domain-containing protein [Arthrobacter sp. H14-L1]|uniref:Wadjet anti-phage system protein JetD domain-containing protein n=1 Tax=Arthrobacter sp. H14-L1 TaxID=2996697 RepID=UPI0022700E7D|nr:DUF3322 and DUF2220 domain-containing protein [Arthrobacter sp. H14-L1]MCY0905846.1 DUF2220 family protein [Arthrobacter sp. H14-L1]